jgi:hypothetical protein
MQETGQRSLVSVRFPSSVAWILLYNDNMQAESVSDSSKSEEKWSQEQSQQTIILKHLHLLKVLFKTVC